MQKEIVQNRLALAVTQLRKDKVISNYRDISDKMNRSYGSVCNAFKGKKGYLTYNFVQEFSEVFDFDIDWLYGNKTKQINNDITIDDLKMIRSRYGKSLDQMADDLKMSKSTLKNWEYRNKRIPENKKELVRQVYREELSTLKGSKTYTAKGTLLFEGADDSFEAEVIVKITK